MIFVVPNTKFPLQRIKPLSKFSHLLLLFFFTHPHRQSLSVGAPPGPLQPLRRFVPRRTVRVSSALAGRHRFLFGRIRRPGLQLHHRWRRHRPQRGHPRRPARPLRVSLGHVPGRYDHSGVSVPAWGAANPFPFVPPGPTVGLRAGDAGPGRHLVPQTLADRSVPGLQQVVPTERRAVVEPTGGGTPPTIETYQ